MNLEPQGYRPFPETMSRSPLAQRKPRLATSELDDVHVDDDDDSEDDDDDFFADTLDLDFDDHGAHIGDDEAVFSADDDFPTLPAGEQEALRLELQNRLAAYLHAGRPRVVITNNLRTMLSVKRGHGVYTFRLHHMFVDASPAVLRAVATYAESQEREAAELLRTFIDENEDAIRGRSTPQPLTVDVAGRYHNLQEIFDELNAHYFAGAIAARITWGPRGKRKRGRSSIKLGSYTVEDELIRIHPVLDAADVPRFFVAWVVYHEMLHEIHDMPVVDGRRIYHTRAFRQAEARFEQYAEAVLWERTQLHRLLDR
ncbi:MAG: hypothetical protein KC457_07200 [Myxococcales bacterium]|nr:hypothetical protein [Myxococcales bacterium]